MNGSELVFNEIRKVGVFYIATVDEGLPRVRPFGATCLYENNLYICTNNTKDVYKQLINDGNVEIVGLYPEAGENWLRVRACAVRDDRDDARRAMLDANPGLNQIYKVGDGIFEVFKLDISSCVKNYITGNSEVIYEK